MTTPLRVLVVEDSEDDMLLQMRELRRGGYEPSYRRVQSAAELKAALRSPDWELVLSDYAMPGFTGLEALRLVQASGLDLPFILISGTVGEDVAVQSMKAGAHDYLLKESLTRLVPAVRRSLADATERRQRRYAEAALRDSQSLLGLIYDHTAEMLLLFAVDERAYRVASMNRAWCDFAARLGVPENGRAFLGRPAEEVIAALASAPAAREILEHFRAASLHGAPVTFDLQWQHGDETLHTEQHFIPVADEHGQARHLLWAAHDATERKRAEDHHRRLEARVAHAEKLEALGTLASGIAHDFNNILAGIAGYLNLVAIDTRELPHVQDSVQRIQGGIERATDLTRRILAFSRKRTVQRRPMHLGPVVEEALAFLRPLIPAGVRVEKTLAPDCPQACADSGQIHQVLLNLATNAVHALEGGSGTLSVSLERIILDGAFAAAHPPLRQGEHVRLTVRDTGCGMDATTRARLFEPFFTTKPPGAGTGLGLAVVLDIVKAHQGAIVVHSASGDGSTFELFFPAAEEAARLQAADRPLPALGHGERILFVDDEHYLAQMGAALLARLGYQVSAFTDPEKALAALAAAPASFDALVTDLTMPGLPGTELASRAQQMRPDLPVIITTGYSGPDDQDLAAQLGPFRLLEKPFTVEKFSELLGRALRRKGFVEGMRDEGFVEGMRDEG